MTPNLLDELEAYSQLCSTPGVDVSFKYQAAANFMNTHAPALADMAKRMEAAERDARRYRFIAAEHGVAWEEDLDAAIDTAINGYAHD